MRKLSAVLLLFALLTAPAWAGDVTVSSFSPLGKLSGKQTRPRFTVVFSGDVVDPSQVDKPLAGDKVPLKIRPAVAGTAVWAAPNKLLFTPSANLRPATRYVADFGPGGLRTVGGTLVGGAQSFEFTTPSLRLERVTLLGISAQRSVTLRVDFNAPVSPVRLRGFLSIRDEHGSPVEYNIRGASPAGRILVDTQQVWGKKLVVAVSAGLIPDKGDLPQETNAESTVDLVAETLVTSSDASMNESGRGRIHVELNSPVDPAAAKGFIELSPALPFTVESCYDGFNVVGGFAPRSRVTMTVRKGLTGEDGKPMKKDFVKSYIFPDVPPSVRFPAAGMFLTPAEAPRIAVETANVHALRLSAWRLYANNVAVAALDSADWNNNFTRWAKPLGAKKFRVDGNVNEITRRAVDLSALGCEGEGIYMVEAQNDDPGAWNRAHMLLAVTDTAVSARLYKRGLQVWATSISDARPVAGASVKVYSSSNQLLLEGTTDAVGVAGFSVDGWEDDLRPALVTAERDGKVSFVKLGISALSGRDVDISGAPWADAYDGMWVLPRALWQPGETLEAQAIVRGAALDLPGEFPLVWKLSGRGIDLAGGAVTLDKNGVGAVSVHLPETIESGTYTLRLLVPGASEAVAERDVSVEEFRPPQVETTVAAPDAMFPGKEGTFDIAARYLFGASGAGLNWELSYTAAPEQYVSKAFPGYEFGSETAKDAGRSSGEIAIGTLDADGKASVTWTPDADLRAPSIVRARIRLNVMEANGRWTGSTVSLPVYPTKALIGVRRPAGGVRPNADAEIGLAAVDCADAPVNLGSVDVEISKVTERYVMVTDDNGSRMTWQEEFSEPEKATVTLNGTGTFVFRPKEEGQYRITFAHADGSASLRLQVWENWQGSAPMGASMPDRVEMKADRESYPAGSTAKVALKSPFAGRAVLTVGGDRPLAMRTFDLTAGETVVEVPVTSETLPNVWVTVQVARPESAGSKPPYRALGAVPLALDLASRRLNVSVEAPKKAEPGELHAEVRVTDAAGAPASGTVSLAFVDRGIILLSGGDNADPWEWFTRLRGMDGKLCDVYDSLLPIESRATALLHPAGGEAGMDAMKMMANADMMSPVRASDYVPLALWLPSVKVENGAADVTVNVPEYAGSLRVEAIAVDGANMGRATAETKIARPVAVDLTLPRFASPGDTIRPTLNVTSEESGAASVSVSPAEGLSQDGPAWKSEEQLTAGARVPLTEKLPALTVGSGSERGVLKVEVSLNGHDYGAEASVAVRPGWPRISRLGGGSAGEGVSEFEVPADWYPGTGEVKISVSGVPAADAVSLLETVNAWGCGLERAVSRGWITLALPALLGGENKDLSNPLENRVALNTVLAEMAGSQLYDGSWSSWPGGGADPWNSVAALHLLTAVRDSGIFEPEALDNGRQWLRRYMAEPLPGDGAALTDAMNARAYGCYVLAIGGEAPLGWMNWLEERAGDLNASGRALLAAAYAVAGEKEKTETLIGSESGGADSPVNLPEDGFRLLALDAIEQGGSPARALADRVAAELSKGGGRRSARDAASMVMALSVFSRHVVPGPVKARLTGPDGAELASFDGSPVTWKGDSGGKMKLTVTGSGSLWYSWTASGVPARKPESYSRGLRVERALIDAETNKPVNPNDVTFGRAVEMRVKVTGPAAFARLRLSMLLPAGFEAQSAGEGAENPGFTARPDLRFDRLILNVEGQGKAFEWTLPCRAVTRGTFSLPPVSVEALGNAGLACLGESGSITVR